MLLDAEMSCSDLDWLPEAGTVLDILALGRSGGSVCGRLVPGAHKVLVVAGQGPVRPVEGETFTLEVRQRSRAGRFWLLYGAVHSPRLEPEALRLEPLALTPRAVVGPCAAQDDEHSQLHYELESVVPRVPGFPAEGAAAIAEIGAFWAAGDLELAELLAGEILARDLRCLEVHALLGGFFLDAPLELRWTERALRHYRVGVAIAELAVGSSFRGRLPWRWRGNRPYLRCLYGYGRCLERGGDAGSARAVFRRLLELAPEDPLDVRALVETPPPWTK